MRESEPNPSVPKRRVRRVMRCTTRQSLGFSTRDSNARRWRISPPMSAYPHEPSSTTTRRRKTPSSGSTSRISTPSWWMTTSTLIQGWRIWPRTLPVSSAKCCSWVRWIPACRSSRKLFARYPELVSKRFDRAEALEELVAEHVLARLRFLGQEFSTEESACRAGQRQDAHPTVPGAPEPRWSDGQALTRAH